LRAVILPQIAEMFHVTPQQRRSRRSNGESTIYLNRLLCNTRAKSSDKLLKPLARE
jgi:hypothetical protein